MLSLTRVNHEAGVSTAAMPAIIIEKGVIADNILLETIIRKAVDHVPLYRQAIRLGQEMGLKSARAPRAVRCSMRANCAWGGWSR